MSSDSSRRSRNADEETTAVNSMEHASLVIRSLRSFSHAQKSYHRQACADDHIFGSLRQFDDMVRRGAVKVDSEQRVNDLIARSTGSSQETVNDMAGGSLISPLAGRVTTSVREKSLDLPSSDDEDNDELVFEMSSGNKTKKTHKGHSSHPAKSSIDEPGTRHIGSVALDSDDDWLCGDNGDTEDERRDMEELMKGFVGPSISVKATNGKHKKNSAIHDLEDDNVEYYITPASQTDNAFGTVKQRGDSDKKQNISGTEKRARSAGTAAGSDSTRFEQSNTPATHIKSSEDRRLKHLGNNNSSVKNIINNSSANSCMHKDEVKMSLTLDGNSRSKQHNVMITPGQRIRVRPSRKKNFNK